MLTRSVDTWKFQLFLNIVSVYTVSILSRTLCKGDSDRLKKSITNDQLQTQDRLINAISVVT